MAGTTGTTGTNLSTILIGAGWVGEAVRSALERQGAQVTVLQRSTHPWLDSRNDAATNELRAEMRRTGSYRVINATGLLRGTPEEMRAANVDLPSWLAASLTGTGARLVHLGSASEYGDPGSATPVPETAPCRATGDYGTTKLAGSNAVLAARDKGLDAVVARGFNLVSPRPAPVSPLAQWIRDVEALPRSGGTVEVWEAGTVRDYILLDDLAAGLASLSLLVEPVPAVVNLCSSVGLRYGDIVAALIERAGRAAEVVSLNQGGIMAVIGDNSLFKRITGLVPEMSVQILVDRLGIRDDPPTDRAAGASSAGVTGSEGTSR